MYAACGFLLAPWLLQRYVPQLLQDRIGRAVSIGEFQTNPFLLTLQAHDVTVAGESGQPMLRADRVVANASLPGLLRGTVALDDLRVEALQLHVVLQADGTLDVVQAAQHWSRSATPSDGGMPPVAIDQLTVPHARVVLADRSGSQPAGAAIGPIELRAKNLSTATDERASYELTIGLPAGGSLASHGELALLPSLQASGSMQLRRLEAQALWPFVRAHMDLSGFQGTVSASADYAYGGSGHLQLSAVAMDASGVRVTRSGAQAPMLDAQRIKASGGAANFGQHTAHIGELVFAEGGARVERTRDGRLDWTGLVRDGRLERAPTAQAAAPSVAAWTVDAPNLRLERMDLAYADHAAPLPLSLQADQLYAAAHVVLVTGAHTGLVAKDLQATAKGLLLRAPAARVGQLQVGATTLQQGHFDLAARQVGAESLRLDGAQATLLQESPPSIAGSDPAATAANAGSAWNVALDKLQVRDLAGRLLSREEGGPPPLAVAAIDGSLKLDLRLGGDHAQVIASSIDARLEDVALAMPSGTSPWQLSSGEVTDGRFDLAARKLSARKLAVSGTAALVRGARGQLVLPALLAQGDRQSPPTRKAQPDWSYAIDQLQVPSLQLSLVDSSAQPTVRVAAKLHGSARNVASDRTASFDLGLALAQGGKLTASGTAAAGGAGAHATIRVSGVALRPFQPLLDRYAALHMRSGVLSSSLDLTYTRGPKSPVLKAEGTLGIADLTLAEAGSGDRLLSWKQLDVQGAALDVMARRLVVREVKVTGPEAKIVVSEDRSLNLAEVFKHAGDAAGAVTAGGEAEAPFQIAVNRVLLGGGKVDFADQSLVLPFSATVNNLDGTVVDISSEPAHRAAVEAHGTIAPYGSANVEGSIVPSNPAAFTDLHVNFNNVEVPPLSPYTATFAGRKVRSGKLWLDLDYLVKEGELRGKNDIRLSNFTLGDRVDAPSALDVPLDLVVALLRDGKGEIQLNVPVTGELGDAHFSLASAVRQAIGNVLKRVVTAPLRALASLFGGKGESLAAIDFLPGSAELRPAQVEKLDALTRALRQRPQLRLVVSAPYDPAQDVAVLRQEQARRALALALGQAAGRDADLGPIAYDDPATRRAIARLVRDQAGDAAVQDVRQRLAERGDRAQSEALFQRLVAAQEVTNDAGRILGVDRAREITGYLQRQGFDSSRLQTGRLTTQRAGKDGLVTAKLELAADGM